MTLYLGTTPIANTGYDRASLSLANVNDAGQILMSSMGMPSTTYVDLTLGASGSTYTAPANGWFLLWKTAGKTGNTYILIHNQTTNIRDNPAVSDSSSAQLSAFIPVRKNDVVDVSYNATGETKYFRFIYAVGSESEAS